MSESVFIPAPFFLWRSPSWSEEDYRCILANERWVDAVFCLYETDEWFKEAIAIASPSLHAILQKKDLQRTEAVAISLLNYATRMASRATPFGLFSFVGMGSWGETERVFDLSKVHKRARPSMSWIYALIQKLCEEKDSSLLVRANPLVKYSGERVAHSYLRRAEKEGKGFSQTVSIRATRLVKAILERSKGPKTATGLYDELVVFMPGLDRQKVQEVIQELLSQQFLLPDLLPSLLSFSPFEDLLLRLSSGVVGKEIIEKINAYNETPLGSGVSLLQELQTEMVSITKAKNPLQVDAVYEGLPLELPHEVKRELDFAVEMLWKLSPRRSSATPLQIHHSKFVEKYGIHRTVPLLELLSEEIGLGPLQDPQPGPLLKTGFAKLWEKWLHREWQECLLKKKQEIVLDQNRVDRFLALADETSHNPQDALNSIDLFCKLYRDRESFLLCLAYPAWQGGSAMGRFLDLFDEKTFAQLNQFAIEEDLLEKNGISFEVSYWPSTGHHANVAVHPCFRKYRLDLLSKKKDARSFSLEDIYVGASSQRFYLTLKEGGCELIARTSNLLNPKFAPSPLYFMREVMLGRHQLLYPFLWGDLEEKAVFLPRVRFRRTVLSPAQWRLAVDELSREPIEKISAQFTAWADQWNLPKYSFLTRDDQQFLIDRHHPAHLKEVALTIRKGAPLQFFEHFDNPWIKSERGHHLCEFVVPCLKNPKYATRKSVVPPTYVKVPAEDRLKGVGSEWLFVKLYLGEEGIDWFLTQHLAPFTKTLSQKMLIAGWFFIRYRDPKPHLRFRLHLTNGSALSLIVSMFREVSSAWIQRGLIQDLVFSNYEREIERYGGPGCIESAEDLFCADSLAVLSVLSDSMSKQLPAPLLHALSVIHFLNGFGLSSTEMITLLNRGELRTSALQGFREHKRQLLFLVRNLGKGGSDPFTHAATLRKEAQDRFSIRAQTLSSDVLFSIYDSMLHMHCNRLGCDAVQEERSRLYALQTLLQIEHLCALGS